MLIELAVEIEDKTWSGILVSTSRRKGSDLGRIVFALDKLRHKLRLSRSHDSEMYNPSQLNILEHAIGVANKAIHNFGVEHFQPLLTALKVPTKELHVYKGEVKNLSMFPQPAAKPREHSKTKAFLEHAAAITLDDVEDMAAPTHLRTIKQLLKKPYSDEELAVAVNMTNPASTQFGVLLHPSSRRKICGFTIWDFVQWIKDTITKETTTLNHAEKYYRNRDGTYTRKPTVNLVVPCPFCSGPSPHVIELRFDEIVPLMARFDPASARTYGDDPATAADGAAAGGGAAAAGRKKIVTSVNDFVTQYNAARMSAARRDSRANMFTCRKPDCKYHASPYIFMTGYGCEGCCKEYKSGGVSHYHFFACPGCTTEACGLCSRPLAEHNGETQICPRAGRVSAAERAAARAEGVNIFCPCCDQAVSRIRDDGTKDGCPHLTCPLCREHFCANCEQVLRVDPVRGSRYVHDCPNKAGDNHYFEHPAVAAADAAHFPVPAAFRMRAEVNPARHHRIDKAGYYDDMPYGHPPLGGGGGGGAAHGGAGWGWAGGW